MFASTAVLAAAADCAVTEAAAEEAETVAEDAGEHEKAVQSAGEGLVIWSASADSATAGATARLIRK